MVWACFVCLFLRAYSGLIFLLQKFILCDLQESIASI